MENIFSSHTQSVAPQLTKKLQEMMPNLTASEARIAQYILLNMQYIWLETGASIAKNAAVSPITVSRFFNKLGFKGIAELKRELKQAMSDIDEDETHGSVSADRQVYNPTFAAEAMALQGIARQVRTAMWDEMTSEIYRAEKVYITGFQSVRGLSEDFSRRLGLVRDGVHYISAHDSMLSEWISLLAEKDKAAATALILIDVVPYSAEVTILARLAVDLGIHLVIFSDESCHWATEYTEHVIYAKSRTGLFLESTSALTLALHLLVDSVAAKNPQASAERGQHWKELTRRLDLF